MHYICKRCHKYNDLSYGSKNYCSKICAYKRSEAQLEVSKRTRTLAEIIKRNITKEENKTRVHICNRCGNYNDFSYNKKFCSRKCAYEKSEAQLEAARKTYTEEIKEKMRKPKLDSSKMGKYDKKGENNPNFGKKLKDNPESYEKFRKAVNKRGQHWDEEQRKNHSDIMKTCANWMKGKTHSTKTKNHISKVKLDQYLKGEIKFNSSNVSLPEYNILELLNMEFDKVIHQYHIDGFRYLYDFYVPSINSIIEFNGDYWHANPEKYESGTYLKIQRIGNVLVDDIWNKDRAKREAAESMGYRFFVLWEKDYNKYGISELINNINK